MPLDCCIYNMPFCSVERSCRLVLVLISYIICFDFGWLCAALHNMLKNTRVIYEFMFCVQEKSVDTSLKLLLIVFNNIQQQKHHQELASHHKKSKYSGGRRRSNSIKHKKFLFRSSFKSSLNFRKQLLICQITMQPCASNKHSLCALVSFNS